MKRRAQMPAKIYKSEPRISSQISRRQSLHHTRALTKPRPEYPIRVLEHAIFQANHDELGTFEPRLDETADVLSMGEI